MVYLYEACDQKSDFCHQQLLRKCDEKYLERTEGRTEVKQYTPLPFGRRGYKKYVDNTLHVTYFAN